MNTSPDPIRVVLADDNIDLTSALCKRLEFEPDIECVGCIADGSDVIEEVTRKAADVLVIDLSIPGREIDSIIGELRLIAPGVRTILYTGFPEFEIVERAFSAGAWRLVCKDSGPQALLGAIRGSAPDLAIAT